MSGEEAPDHGPQSPFILLTAVASFFKGREWNFQGDTLETYEAGQILKGSACEYPSTWVLLLCFVFFLF